MLFTSLFCRRSLARRFVCRGASNLHLHRDDLHSLPHHPVRTCFSAPLIFSPSNVVSLISGRFARVKIFLQQRRLPSHHGPFGRRV